MPETVDRAADAVYAASPEDFLTTRAALAEAAKAEGDTAAAKAIGALRKPTLAASLVNRLVLGDDSVAPRVADLGDRLRAAHEALDAAVLRELTTERRALVDALTRSATSGGASAAVRDEVSATFDSAVADPSVTVRLGRLTKGERWSGFGVAAAGPPTLTVVRGGRSSAPARRAATDDAATDAPAGRTAAKKALPAASAKLTRLVTRAREAYDAAEEELTAADGAERSAGERVRALAAELTAAQKELEAAKVDQDAARKAARTARTRRREARSALDRAERNRERGH